MKIWILLPVFNDWESCGILLRKAEQELNKRPEFDYSFIIVDDFSSQALPSDFGNDLTHPFKILPLNRNVGHQRAIALGLCYVKDELPCDYVVVMDADGEDRPQDITALLDKAVVEVEKIVFAKRSKRFEGFWFRFFYSWYKFIFRLLTGKSIAFGNFCAIPYNKLKNIVYVSELWNHFSGGVIRSRIPYTSIPLERGVRLAGYSKMNFISLVMHGLSAISVYTDTLAVRILLSSIGLIFISLLSIFVVAGIKLMTPFAIPGWASYIVIGILIIIFQAFMISLFLVFNVLNYRTQQHFIPALEYKKFIEN
jgi:polyisoprenyl-phosphate glycosyltransferase